MSRLVFKAAVLLLIAATAAIAQPQDRSPLPGEVAPGLTPNMDRSPLPGEVAPDFTLNTKDGTRSVTLSEQTGRPTVLIFASYT